MNDGKICISICAKTADELFTQVARAEALADVIEVRFDYLERAEIEKALGGLKGAKPFLFTYRPESQGGHISDDLTQRILFWMTVFSKCELENDQVWLDNEIDIVDSLQWPESHRVIASFHDFTGTPADIGATYENLASAGRIVKLAAAAEEITDAIPLWSLLDKGGPVVPIAIGEAGKWTRILALAHGSFMTYTSLDAGSETAPGQISAVDMADVFRAKELDRETQIYGVVAGDTSYSVSPWMHNAGFRSAGMNRVFVPLQVADLDEFIHRMVRAETREVQLNFAGFSVTNPHKQAIVRHLDEVDETAAKIGAVNTVRIENNKFYGYNTDAPGFIAPLRKSFGDLNDTRIAVVGAGGAARACIYALQKEGAEVTLFARDERKAKPLVDEFGAGVKKFEISNLKSDISKLDSEISNLKSQISDSRSGFSGFDILVNATPLGTKGEKQNETVATADQLRGVKLVYDLIYNPLETRLIREAKAAGVAAIGGLEMLIAQGAKQFEIWTGEAAPVEAMAAAVKKKLDL